MKAVILAGGAGSRLWPLSRDSKPKQFQSITGYKTMLQETVERIDFLKPEEIYISTNSKYLNLVKTQVAEFKIPEENIIIEPCLRDTAPCIGLAATYIAKKHPNETMCVIYADHLIQDKDELVEKLKIAEKVANEENTLNIIEVKAKTPNVNLGYVKIGRSIKEINGTEIYTFEGFTEKPDLATAKKFVESFNYLWNTGLYVWKVDTILKYYRDFLPKTHKQLMIIKDGIGTVHEKETLDIHYPKCDKISIDYGIMEKVDKKDVLIIPAVLGWSDVGTWESILEELPRDENGNLVRANHHGVNTSNSLVFASKDKLIATVGLDNLVIVDTDDVLLVCKKTQSQHVKRLVQELKDTKHKELL